MNCQVLKQHVAFVKAIINDFLPQVIFPFSVILRDFFFFQMMSYLLQRIREEPQPAAQVNMLL